MRSSLNIYGYELPLTEGRKKILTLTDEPPLEDLLAMFRLYGFNLVKSKDELGAGDCKNWAFEHVGLKPNYGGFLQRDWLYEGKIKKLRPTKELGVGNLTAYFIDRRYLQYNHWGVCVKENDKLMIVSRWGSSHHLFMHPLEIVPLPYGNFVDFFEVVSDHKVNTKR